MKRRPFKRKSNLETDFLVTRQVISGCELQKDDVKHLIDDENNTLGKQHLLYMKQEFCRAMKANTTSSSVISKQIFGDSLRQEKQFL